MAGGIAIKPLNDRVVVKPIEPEETTKGGIIIPDTASKEKPMMGEVVAVGDGAVKDDGSRRPMSVKVGDKVLFSKYSPEEIDIDGEKYLIMREDSILAILEK